MDRDGSVSVAVPVVGIGGESIVNMGMSRLPDPAIGLTDSKFIRPQTVCIVASAVSLSVRLRLTSIDTPKSDPKSFTPQSRPYSPPL